MAPALWLTGTVSMMSVFTGPVDRNSRNMEKARNIWEIIVSFTSNATRVTGIAAETERPSTHPYARLLCLCQADAVNPPRNVPRIPEITSTAPKKVAADFSGMPCTRCRKLGPH